MVSQMEPSPESSLPALLQWERSSPCSFIVDRKYRKYSCVFISKAEHVPVVLTLNEPFG